ncbi:MAG: Rrf2 family transcriptional regulator [Chloroflexi bacterium]|nr:Rrf2 family transcriptional regulator [Chloroflexota bacterium]
MQITRQADYAVRAMVHLARLKSGQRASTSQISEEQRIPLTFLAKIVSQLSVAGLLHTTRGARGGVALARPADEISLLEVVEAIDGPMALNECTSDTEACLLGEECVVRDVWCEARADLVKRLAKTKFSQFVNGKSNAVPVAPA